MFGAHGGVTAVQGPEGTKARACPERLSAPDLLQGAGAAVRPLTSLPARTAAPATWVLLAANVAAFLGIAAYTRSLNLPLLAAVRFGALYPGALAAQDGWGGEWRLVASGFLHFSPMHLLFNMVCLASWGTVIERRLGTAGFLLIYLASLLGGSAMALAEPRGVTAGASGALAGLLGALLLLSLRRRVDMPVASIAVTVALNVAFTFGVAGISWRAHLGGFAAGILAGLWLDAASWVAARTLRRRFPEWLKLDLLLVAALAALQLPFSAGAAVVLLLCIMAVVKAADFALARRHGPAAVAGAALLAQAGLLARGGSQFGVPGVAAAALMLATAAALHLGPLRRGFQDRSFAAAPQGRREQGL